MAVSILALTAALAASPVAADEEGGGVEPMLVTDPFQLEQSGYPAGAEVYTDGNGNFFALVSGNSSVAADLFGPSSESVSVVQPTDFRQDDEQEQWDIPNETGDIQPDDNDGEQITCPAGETQEEFMGSVHLPSGVLITGFDYYGRDTDAGTENEAALVKVCQDEAGMDDPRTDPIGLGDGFGSTAAATPGNFKVMQSDLTETVNNRLCTYHVWINLGDGGCVGTAVRAYKARVRWMRQISPEPAMATFSDVQPGDPFFQGIEAMAAAGITGGCGGGNFCPNETLTRGQMAAFLARAMGLHWDGF